MDSAREWRGGQVQLGLLAEGMTARGHRAVVAAPADGAFARRWDGPFLPLPAGPGAILALRRYVRDLHPHLVAAHTARAHGLCLLAGVAPVVHRRVDFAVGRSLASRWKYRRARLFVAVSGAVAGVLVRGGVPSARIRVVHDGVRPPAPAAPAADLAGAGSLVGSVGALVGHKGHRVLVAALAELPGLRCVLAGQGPLRPILAAQIEALGLRDRVRLLGQRNDVPAVLAALDLLVHPSLEEGLGQVVIEAMALGRPVLVTRAGGLPEVVGATSTPVPPGDASALASAIRARLEDPGDLAAARARALGEFSAEAMVAGTLAAYEEALDHEETAP